MNDLRAASQHAIPLPSMICGEAAPGGLLTQGSHDEGFWVTYEIHGGQFRDIKGAEGTLALGYEE